MFLLLALDTPSVLLPLDTPSARHLHELLVFIIIMNSDDFEWDERKAAINLRNHKISFQEASRVFDDLFALIEQDLSEDYSEDRFMVTGMIEGLLVTVVYTERGDRIRIISARKANRDERRKYYRSQTPA